MDVQQVVDLGQEALLAGLLVSAPALVVGLLVGSAVSLLQALTQMQEQSVAFVAKLVAVAAGVGVCLPWLLEYLVAYTEGVISRIPLTITGG